MQILVVTRHQELVQHLSQHLPGANIVHMQELPQDLSSYNIVVGVLPIHLIKQVTDAGKPFIYIGIDPEKYKQITGKEYNPKDATATTPEMYRGVQYRSVEMKTVSGEEFLAKIEGKKVYYVGSPVFEQALSKYAQITKDPKSAEVFVSPYEGAEKFYSLTVLDRNKRYTNPEEVIEDIKKGGIRINQVKADIVVLENWEKVITSIRQYAYHNKLSV